MKELGPTTMETEKTVKKTGSRLPKPKLGTSLIFFILMSSTLHILQLSSRATSTDYANEGDPDSLLNVTSTVGSIEASLPVERDERTGFPVKIDGGGVNLPTDEKTSNSIKHNQALNSTENEPGNDSPESALVESSVTSLSPGMDMFENVCVDHNPGNYIQIRSYSKNPTDLKAHYYKNYRMSLVRNTMHKTKGFPLEQMQKDSKGYFFPNETIWLMYPYVNPAHCLMDMANPLAFDYLVRNQNKTAPFYGNYVLGKWKKFLDEPMSYYCGNFLEVAGYIDHRKFLKVKPGITCFRKLLLPAVFLFRQPLSRSEDESSVKDHLQNVKYLHHHYKDPSLDFPAEALAKQRERVTEYYNLPHNPWPLTDENQEKQILFHIRGKKQRRKILNAKELKSVMESRFNVNITLISDGYVSLNYEQQARLYNSFEYIMAPHGAHLANAIYCRPKTKIIEFVCSLRPELYPDPNITERGPTTTNASWYGSTDIGWFSSWTRRIQIEHFDFGQDLCTNKVPHRKEKEAGLGPLSSDFSIDIQKWLPFIESRFGLVRRSEEHSNITLLQQ